MVVGICAGAVAGDDGLSDGSQPMVLILSIGAGELSTGAIDVAGPRRLVPMLVPVPLSSQLERISNGIWSAWWHSSRRG